jgi:hypothetical protein
VWQNRKSFIWDWMTKIPLVTSVQVDYANFSFYSKILWDFDLTNYAFSEFWEATSPFDLLFSKIQMLIGNRTQLRVGYWETEIRPPILKREQKTITRWNYNEISCFICMNQKKAGQWDILANSSGHQQVDRMLECRWIVFLHWDLYSWNRNE